MSKKKWIFWKDNSPRKNLSVSSSMLAGAVEVYTLIRELIQNSRDARISEESPDPVELVIEKGAVNRSEIYDVLCLDDLREHIQGTLDFAGDGINAKRVGPKSRGQLDLLKQSSIAYFKFSDYNTKGMAGVSGYDSSKALWKLLFEEGTSSKDDASAGGVGVGKNATFPFSSLSTVIYVTKTDEGYGLAGSTRLASSQVGGQTYEKDGNLVSYDCNLSDILDNREFGSIKPLAQEDVCNGPDSIFYRERVGSDVIILGTEGSRLETPDWAESIAVHAIKNFFIAFRRNKISLTIKTDGGPDICITGNSMLDVLQEILSKEDLSPDLEDEAKKSVLLIKTFDGASEGNQDIVLKHTDDLAIGPVSLYMNRTSDANEKAFYLYRSFGMKTIRKSVKSQKPVIGVVVVESKKGSDYLLAAEAGNHTEYDFDALGADPQGIKVKVNELEKWITNEIRMFGQIDTQTTDIDLAGFSNFVSLEDELLLEEDSQTKPIIEVVPPKAAPKKKDKKKPVRKRDSGKADPNSGGDDVGGSQEFDHDPERHRHWTHERHYPGNNGEGEGEKKTYEKTLSVTAMFRDNHASNSDEAELIGSISSKVYREVDVTISAVDEQSNSNFNLPPILTATDHNTGTVLALSGSYQIKNVPVDDSGYVHVDVKFVNKFRGVLLETATVTKIIEMTVPTSPSESEGQVNLQEIREDTDDESSN